MALTLKTTGVASLALCVVAVDDDNTVKDFIVNNNETVHANVSVGSGTWGGVDRGYFETKHNGLFDYYGITWTSSGSSIAPFTGFQDGLGVYAAFNAYVSGSHFWGNNGQNGWRKDSDNRPGWYVSSNFRLKGTTSVATGIKFSYATNFKNVATSVADWYYGVEGGALTLEATSAATGAGSNGTLADLGGISGVGRASANWHIFAIFSRPLTTGEAEGLHADWFGTFFTSAGTSSSGGGGGEVAADFRSWYTRSSLLVGR